jgi:hypothetical protein
MSVDGSASLIDRSSTGGGPARRHELSRELVGTVLNAAQPRTDTQFVVERPVATLKHGAFIANCVSVHH